jgi:adenine-specific DNA-methyltransferase
MMRERLLLIQELLSDDGTVWVHLDAAEVHRCRILMDEIFGPSNYLSTVVWQRTTAKSLAKRTMGTMHEEILVYGASEKAELQSNFTPLDAKYAAKRFSQVDERGPYDTGDLTAGSYRPHLDSGKPWRGFDPSSRRRCWAVPGGPLGEIGLEPSRTRTMGMLDKLDALDNAGYIHWPDKPGGFPRYKKYLHQAKGIALGDLWNDINVINSQAAERTGFSTQKPEALLKRILTIASRPDDIVVDCFAGSGTTAAVAHKMGRRWVTVERSSDTVKEFALPRLRGVIEGTDLGGITIEVVESSAAELPDDISLSDVRTTKRVLQALNVSDLLKRGFDTDTSIAALVEEIERIAKAKKTERRLWSGGGGFRVLELAPSIYDVDQGRAFLAKSATNGRFAEAVAAQLGFHIEHDAPFSGRKGRSRLAVIDGVVDVDVVRAVVSRLDDGDHTVLVGKGTTPEAGDLLRSMSPGSRLRKAPRDLLNRGVVR